MTTESISGPADRMPYRVLPFIVVLVLSVFLLTGLGEIVDTLEGDDLLVWKWHNLPSVPGVSACLSFQLLQLSWALSGLLLCTCPTWSGWFEANRLTVTIPFLLAGWVLEAVYLSQTGDDLLVLVIRTLVAPLLASWCFSLPLRLRLLSHGFALSTSVAAVRARPDAVTVSAGLSTALVLAHTSGVLLPLLLPASTATRRERSVKEGPVCEPVRRMETVSAGVGADAGERKSEPRHVDKPTLDLGVRSKDSGSGSAEANGTGSDGDVNSTGGVKRPGVSGWQRPVNSDPGGEIRELGAREPGREFEGAAIQLNGEENEEDEGDDFEERIMEQAAVPGIVRDSSESVFTGRPNASAALIGTASDSAVSALLRNREGGSNPTGEPPPREAERGPLQPRASLVLTNEERMATTTSRLIALAGAVSGKLSRGGSQPGFRVPPARGGVREPTPPSSTTVVRSETLPPIMQSSVEIRERPAEAGGSLRVSASGLATQSGGGVSRPTGLAAQTGGRLSGASGLGAHGGSGLSQPPASRKGKEKMVETEPTAKPTARPSGLRVLPGVSEREREALSATYAAVSAARAAEALGATRPWGTGAGLPTTELDYRAGGGGNWQSPRWSGLGTEWMSWMQEMEFMGPGWDGGISRTDDEKAPGRGVVSGVIEGGGDEEESDEDEDFDFAKMEEKYRGLLGNMRGFGGSGFRTDVSKGYGDNSKGQADVSKGSGDVSKGHADVSRGFADVSRGFGVESGLGLSESAALGGWGMGLDFAAALSDESESDEDLDDLSDEDEEDGWDEGQGFGGFANPVSYPVPDPNPAINPWGLYPEQQKQWLDAIARGNLPMPSDEKGVLTPSASAGSAVNVNAIAAPRFVLDASSPVLRVEPPQGNGPTQPGLERGPPLLAVQPVAGTGLYPVDDLRLGAPGLPAAASHPRFDSHAPQAVRSDPADKLEGRLWSAPGLGSDQSDELGGRALGPARGLVQAEVLEGQLSGPAAMQLGGELLGSATVRRNDPAEQLGGRDFGFAAVRFGPVEELEERLLGPAAGADIGTYLSTSERITQLLSAPVFTLDASVSGSSAPGLGTAGVNAPGPVPAGVNAPGPVPAGVNAPNAVATGVNAPSLVPAVVNVPNLVSASVIAPSLVSAGVNGGAFSREDLLAASQRITELLAAPIYTLDASVATVSPGGGNRGETSTSREEEHLHPSPPPTGRIAFNGAAPSHFEPKPAPSFPATAIAPPIPTATTGGTTGTTDRGQAGEFPVGLFLPRSFSPLHAETLQPTPASSTPVEIPPPNASMPSTRTLRSGKSYPSPAKPVAFEGSMTGSIAGCGQTDSEAEKLLRGATETGALLPGPGAVFEDRLRGVNRGVERPSTEPFVGFDTPAFKLDANRPIAGQSGGGVSSFSPAFTLDASRPFVGSSGGGVSDFAPAFTLDANRPPAGPNSGGVSGFAPAFTLDASRPPAGTVGGGVSDFRPAFTLDATRPVVGPNSGSVSGISPPVITPASDPAGMLAASCFTLDARRPAQQVSSSLSTSEAAPSFTLDASKGFGTVGLGTAAPLEKGIAGRTDGAKADGYAWTQMTERLARRSNGRGMSKVDQEWLKVMERVKDKLPQMQVEWKPELHIPFDALGN